MILKTIWISLLSLAAYIKTQTNEICQNPDDPNECLLVETLTTEEFYFDFTSKNKIFSIIGQNCKIFSYRNFSIKVPTNDFKVTISLTNCEIKSKDISIDLGGLESGSSVILDSSSSINSNAMSNSTRGMPIDSDREMVCYTGCVNIDSEYVYGANDIEYDFTKGDNEILRTEEFYGSGDDKLEYQDNRFTWGGGRVYIRASFIQFLDLGSHISSSGYQGDGAQQKGDVVVRSGTGGSVIIATREIKFGLRRKEKDYPSSLYRFSDGVEKRKQSRFVIPPHIMAEGSFLYKQLSTNLGGGGRIFLIVKEMKYADIKGIASVTGYGLMFSDYRANSGRVVILTMSSLNMIVQNNDDEHTLKTAATLLNFKTPSSQYNNIAYFKNCNITNYLKNNIANYYSVTLNYTIYNLINKVETNPNEVQYFMMKTANLTVVNKSVIYVNVSALYEIATTEEMHIGDSSNITLFQGSFVKLTGPVVKFIDNSLGNVFDSGNIYSNLRPPTILIVKSDEIIIQDSAISIDKILLSPDSVLLINGSSVSNVKSSCPREADAVKMDWFLRNCNIGSEELKGDCKLIWDENFLEVELPSKNQKNTKKIISESNLETNISFLLINFPGKEWSTNSTNIKNIGYFGLRVKNFTLDESSSIIASSSGCQALNPEIDSTLSKYIKHCKVKGGSNLGRGTMGRMVNLQLCNFLIPMPKNSSFEFEAVPGEGGQKSHQTEDSSNFGYGGGVINIFSDDVVYIKGTIAADGGVCSVSGFTMVAGGSGGSVKISSGKINFYENLKKEEGVSQISARGGDSSDQLGGGGGGKIILNCSNWESNPDCIEITGKVNISTSSGDFSHNQDKPLYFLTMNMMEGGKEFIFNGGVVNINSCLRGRHGPFCEECPQNTYKPTIDIGPCIPCPCQSISISTGETSILSCDCPIQKEEKLTVVKIGAIFFVFVVLLLFFHILMKKKKKYEDKNYLSDLRYKVNDIPNSFGRIYVVGSNTPHQPWKIDRLNKEISKFFQVRNFNQFRKEFEEVTSWSNLTIYMLTILNVLFYSPIYLSIIRILRISRVNQMIQLLERQSSFNIFREEKHDPGKKSKKFVLKWTTTSDQSTLFFDIVRKTGDEKIKFNWKLKFPQSFIIFGNGTYNRPFKLEIRDPLLIKMIDHLKDIVNNSERYHTIFKIPSYIVNSIKVINQESHFMEYFFCILNTHLKSLDTLGNKGNFISKFKIICSYLQKANAIFMAINGYSFRLELILENSSKKRIRKNILDIPLSSPKEIKEAASFFYDVINYPGDSIICNFMLWIDESKFLIMDKKLKAGGSGSVYPRKRRSFSVERIALLMDGQRARKMSDDFRRSLNNQDLLEESKAGQFLSSIANNEIVRLKNEFRKKIISEKMEEEENEFDYYHLRSVYVDSKKFNPLTDNFIVRFLSFYIYKQYMVGKKMNYLVGVIFILLVFQMGSLIFSIYNLFFENLTGSSEITNFIVLEWIAPFPFSQFFSMTLGITCFITNWKVKVGKMFVSANMICVVNLFSSLMIWSFLLLIYKTSHYDYILFYSLPNMILRVSLSYFACLQVSKIQAAKTMGKILKARNFQL